MSTHRRLNGALLILALAVLAGCTESMPADPSPSFAAANKPERSAIHEDVDDVVSCGTFELSVVGTLDETSTTFFDRQGTPVRVQGLLQVRLTVTNLSTGESLHDNVNSPFALDLATGVVVNTGVFANIKDGIRIRDIGRFVWDEDTNEVIFQAGPHDLGLDVALRDPLLCQALA